MAARLALTRWPSHQRFERFLKDRAEKEIVISHLTLLCAICALDRVVYLATRVQTLVRNSAGLTLKGVCKRFALAVTALSAIVGCLSNRTVIPAQASENTPIELPVSCAKHVIVGNRGLAILAGHKWGSDIELIDLRTHMRLGTVPNSKQAVDMAISDSGRHLFMLLGQRSHDYANRLVVYDIHQRQVVGSFSADKMAGVTFCGDLIIVCRDRVLFWREGDYTKRPVSVAFPDNWLAVAGTRAVHHSETGVSFFRVGNVDGHWRIARLDHATRVVFLGPPLENFVPVGAVAVSKSGNLLAVSHGVDVAVLDTATLRMVQRLTMIDDHGGGQLSSAISHVFFERGDRYVIATRYSWAPHSPDYLRHQTIAAWHLPTGMRMWMELPAEVVNWVEVVRNSTPERFIAADERGKLWQWNMRKTPVRFARSPREHLLLANANVEVRDDVVVAVEMSDDARTAAHDKLLLWLRYCRDLERVVAREDPGGRRITAAGLTHLGTLHHLTSLDLRTTRLERGSDFFPLQQLDKLALLELEAPRLRSIAFLGKLKSLSKLRIETPTVPLEEYDVLAECSSIRELTLDRLPKITTRLVSTLCRMPRLETLAIDHSVVSPGALAELRKSPSLSKLGLFHVQLTDTHIAELVELDQIRVLYLVDCDITSAQCDRLEAAFGGDRVKIDPRPREEKETDE